MFSGLADVTIDRRAIRVLREEFSQLNCRRSACLAVTKIIPDLVGNRLRATLMRLAGLSIGHGTVVGGAVRITGGSRLIVGRNCWINVGCHIDTSAAVTIGDGVGLAHEVLILTNTHDIGDAHRRAGELEDKPVSIGEGAWLGARSIVLPGVSVGAGAIVAAGAVVARDVQPNTIVGGVPARFIRRLDD